MDDQAGASDKLHLLRAQRWSGFLKGLESGDDWVSKGLLPVARAAREHPQLGLLFPFQSHNRLCFSRCFPGPYTNDCPCIAVDRLGRFGVSAFPYPRDAAWEVAPPYVGDAEDADDAIDLAAGALPPNGSDVWLSDDEAKKRSHRTDAIERIATALASLTPQTIPMVVIEAPGTGIYVRVTMAPIGFGAEAIGESNLRKLIAYHTGPTMRAKLPELGWSEPVDPVIDHGNWTRFWPSSEWDPVSAARSIVRVFDEVYGLNPWALVVNLAGK